MPAAREILREKKTALVAEYHATAFASAPFKPDAIYAPVLLASRPVDDPFDQHIVFSVGCMDEIHGNAVKTGRKDLQIVSLQDVT